MYTINDWIAEEKKAIAAQCPCSLAIAELRKENRDQDLEECPCKSHSQIMGHCCICGAKK